MKRAIQTIVFGMALLFLVTAVHAENVAGTSAYITYNTVTNSKENELFLKKLAIKHVLELYGSPLSNNTDTFINACLSEKFDCYLLPSITGLESTFGQFIYPQSFNPFGWGGGLSMFKSWDDGINTVAQGLKQHYVNKGAVTLSQIGSIYSESPTWTTRVQYFMNQFSKEEEKLQLILGEKQVQL